MARYVYHGATAPGTSAGSFDPTWAGAYASLADAVAGAPGGEVFYISKLHRDPAANGSVTFPTNLTAPCSVICVDHATGLYAPSDPDVPMFVSPSGAYLDWTGSVGYVAGISALPGGGKGTSGIGQWRIGHSFGALRLKDIRVQPTTNNGSRAVHTNGGAVILDTPRINVGHVTVSFNGGNPSVRVIGDGGKIWDPAAGSTIPNMVVWFSAQACDFVIENVDLLDIGSGKNLTFGLAGSFGRCYFTAVTCRINSVVGIPSGAAGFFHHAHGVDLINCYDENMGLRHERHSIRGVVSATTSVYRQDGATDGDVSTSWEFKPTLACNRWSPLESFEVDFTVPAEKIGVPTTVEFHVLYDAAVAALTGSDVNAIVLASDVAAAVAMTPRYASAIDADAPLTDDTTSTWVGADTMTTPTPKKLSVTFTPQRRLQKAIITCSRQGALANVAGMSPGAATTAASKAACYVDPAPRILP